MHRIKKYLIILILVAIFGEIYFYPLNSTLRFSAGIIILNLVILIYDDISQFGISILSGISVFILRSVIGLLFSSMSFIEIIMLNFPSFFYYIMYGILAELTTIRQRKDQFVTTILILIFIDTISNICEFIIRNKGLALSVVQLLLLVAISRSIIAYSIYLLYKKQELLISTREHQKRYTQLNILVSNIQAEMFYLKKSMHDIEKVMSKSYQLYEKYKEDEILKESTLDIAREVHEIKKDYYRVLNGFGDFLDSFEKNGTMRLSDMAVIIRENTYRYLKEKNKDLSIHFHFKDNLELEKYYNLFTIINNLIINAIDACKNKGIIEITQESNRDSLFFYVKDNGEGIEQDMIPYIFNPGFTTKYDENSGEPSTGIGLAHVKNIVDDFGGTIDVISHVNKGTTFKVTLPKNTLVR
ncbi:ATP-binding protein [Clostridiaceae bacterium 35-E11]